MKGNSVADEVVTVEHDDVNEGVLVVSDSYSGDKNSQTPNEDLRNEEPEQSREQAPDRSQSSEDKPSDDDIPTNSEVTVSARAKKRKPQTDEQYKEQLASYRQSGPRINTEDWLYDDLQPSDFQNSSKSDRVRLLQAVEKAYFKQDYLRCRQLISLAQAVFGIEDEEEAKAAWDQSGRKVKKSAKLERHVIDLLHIKQRLDEIEKKDDY
ncbi:hypothetical protein G9P44_003648 [Scheffersomyces stipitis]|nr:hypothetical protein G9P44_003648 [Scheffersomyces stipitis]